ASPLPGDIKILSDKAILQSQTDNERTVPNDSTNFQEHDSYGKKSMGANSWVFPRAPKLSQVVFGEIRNK
ncbi:hypothetical protein DBR06_SOUSAS11210018, partial [Sousa chinensis]